MGRTEADRQITREPWSSIDDINENETNHSSE
jgi:hypothetical protein